MAEFAAALAAYAGSVLSAQDTAPVERVDAVVDGSELGMALAEELRDWRRSARATRRCRCCSATPRSPTCDPMGEGKHARFTVRSPAGRARAVAFNMGGRLPVAEGEPAQATFTLEVNEWNGVSEPRLVLRHARAEGAPRIEDRRSTRVVRRRAMPPRRRPVCRSWCCSAEGWRQMRVARIPEGFNPADSPLLFDEWRLPETRTVTAAVEVDEPKAQDGRAAPWI